MVQQRERLASRLGFILLSAGCAIGIGNVWRFPYVTGQSGGAWFVLIYLACLALVGLPILTMEFACGRAAQRSIATLHAVLTPERPAWRLHGALGMAGLVVLMMFYTVVTGWMFLYFLKMASGGFAGLDAAQVAGAFGGMLADPWAQGIATAGVCGAAALICGLGVAHGLERVTKALMLALLLLLVALAAHSVFLPGASKGLAFYLLPDLARLRATGVWTVIGNAMNQAFFTLSLGIGSMSIFGSYITRRHALLGEAVTVTALDTFVALAAGLVILPACFAFDIPPAQGPGLVFVTLPNVFNRLALGRLWGALFFLFMFFAAFTTVLAVFEGIIAGLMEYAHWARRRVCLLLAPGLFLLSLPCILGFNVWRAWGPLGPGTNVLDLEDFLVSDLALPLGALVFVVYCTYRFGWGWTRFRAEANAGKGLAVPAGLRRYCAYVLPLLVGAIVALSLIQRFHRS